MHNPHMDGLVSLLLGDAPTEHIHMSKNISNFLSAASAYGVDMVDLFDIDDLLQDEDPFRVAHSLVQLKKVADAK